jgi:hypothetical protein
MAWPDDDVTTDPLTAAVVEAARHAAGDVWGAPPRLYALALRASLNSSESNLPAQVGAARPDTLVPIEQDPLPEGIPAEVLAGIYWPPGVLGCVLVTEVVIEDESPAEGCGTAVDEAPQRHARLTVGVLRDGEKAAHHACCVQQQGSDDLIITPDIADELVAALLGTL